MFQDLIPPTPSYLSVHVDTFIFEVSKIDDLSLTVTYELYMDLTWKETRIVINQTSDMWGPHDSFMGSTNFVKNMWLPDIQVKHYHLRIYFQTCSAGAKIMLGIMVLE